MLRNFYIGRVFFGANKVPIVSSLAPTPKGASSSSGTQNYLYALTTNQEFDELPDVVTSMLKLFSHDVYYLLDLGSTLSYVTSFVVVHFSFSTESISNSFSISTPVGDSLISIRAYKGVWYLLVVKKLWWIYLN